MSIDADMAMTYLDFVIERHRVWERRQAGLPGPWTEDPVLAGRKFTNMFRVLDHGSQFVVRELLYGPDEIEPEDALARCFLYRYNNRPEPWEYFYQMNGRYPYAADLDDGTVLHGWREYKATGQPLFGNAYKMFCGPENKGSDRLTWAVEAARIYAGLSSPLSIRPAFTAAGSLQERLDVLRTVPRCANFMAMQIVTDLGYLYPQDENELVLAGPGCIVGAKHVAPSWPTLKVIEWAWDHWQTANEAPQLPLPDGRTRRLSLMDVQNSFCEFGKYVRWMGIPQQRVFRPAHPGPQAAPVLPRHW
jgi:hypothetical protein